MLKNHKLSKSISDCSFSIIRSMLDYKCKWYGRQLVVIDRWVPTSKTYSECGYVMKDWNLDIREWICPNCHTHHDRDINAAKNILSEGMKILDRAGTARIEACGEQSSISEMKCSCSVKQETDRSLVGLWFIILYKNNKVFLNVKSSQKLSDVNRRKRTGKSRSMIKFDLN